MASIDGPSLRKHPPQIPWKYFWLPTKITCKTHGLNILTSLQSYFQLTTSFVKDLLQPEKIFIVKKINRYPIKPAAVSRLNTPLKNNFINILLDQFDLVDHHQGNHWLWLNTLKGVEGQMWYDVHPSLLISGSGWHFLGFWEPSLDRHYASGILPIMIGLEGQDETFSWDCLRYCVQQLLSYKHNVKKSVWGVLLSKNLIWILWIYWIHCSSVSVRATLISSGD